MAPKAKALYEKIIVSYGNKAQMWRLAIDQGPASLKNARRSRQSRDSQRWSANLPGARQADETSARRVRRILVLLGAKPGRQMVLAHQGGLTAQPNTSAEESVPALLGRTISLLTRPHKSADCLEFACTECATFIARPRSRLNQSLRDC